VLGDWILRAALPFYVYARTSSPLASGIALLVEAVPWVLLSSIAGVLADRWDRKRTLLLADLASGTPLLALALAGPQAPLWTAYPATLVVTAIGLVSGPAGSALLPQPRLGWSTCLGTSCPSANCSRWCGVLVMLQTA
jgi:MFS family permease